MSLRRSAAPAGPTPQPIDQLFAGIDIGSPATESRQQLLGKPKFKNKPPVVPETYRIGEDTVLGKSWGIPPEEILQLLLVDPPPMANAGAPRTEQESGKLLRALVATTDQNGDGTIDQSDTARLMMIGGQPLNDTYTFLKAINFQNADAANVAAFEAAVPDWRQGTSRDAAAALAAKMKATLLEELPDLAIQGVLVQDDMQSLLACVADPVDAAVQMKARLIAANNGSYTAQGAALDRLIRTAHAETRTYIDKAVNEAVPLYRGLNVASAAMGVPLDSVVDAALLCDVTKYRISGPDDAGAQRALFVLKRGSYPIDNADGVEDKDAANLPVTVMVPAKKQKLAIETGADVGAKCAIGTRRAKVPIITSHGAIRNGELLKVYPADPFYVSAKERGIFAKYLGTLSGFLETGGSENEKVKELVDMQVPWGAKIGKGGFLSYVKCQMLHDNTPTQALVKAFAKAISDKQDDLFQIPISYAKGAIGMQDAPNMVSANERALTGTKTIEAGVEKYKIGGPLNPVEASNKGITPAQINANTARIAMMVEFIVAIVDCASAQRVLNTNAIWKIFEAIVSRRSVERSGSYLYNPLGVELNTADSLQDPPDVVAILETAHAEASKRAGVPLGRRDRLRPSEWDGGVAVAANFPADAAAFSRASLALLAPGVKPTQKEVKAAMLRVDPLAVELHKKLIGALGASSLSIHSATKIVNYLWSQLTKIEPHPGDSFGLGDLQWLINDFGDIKKCYKTDGILGDAANTCRIGLRFARDQQLKASGISLGFKTVVRDACSSVWSSAVDAGNFLDGARKSTTGATVLFSAFLLLVYHAKNYDYKKLELFWLKLNTLGNNRLMRAKLINEFKKRLDAAQAPGSRTMSAERKRLEGIEKYFKERGIL